MEVIEKKPTPNYLKVIDSSEVKLKNMLVENIVGSYNHAVDKHGDFASLAISFPGPVNNRGEVIGSSVIFGKPLQESFRLKEMLTGQIAPGVIILVTNDITASAWRYSDKYGSFCLITVSSGIGSKIFSNSKVLIGDNGLSGEIGHIAADISELSIPCDCGWGNNHIGILSSGRGIENVSRVLAAKDGLYRSLFLSAEIGDKVNGNEQLLTSELIACYADVRDVFSMTIIDYCTKPLAKIICMLSLALHVEKFIIIGGFALNCKYYLESLRLNAIKNGIYNFKSIDIKNMIIYGENDDNHALIGLGKMMTKH